MKTLWIVAAGLGVLAALPAQSQKSSADAIAEYRKMLEDGNPADLFEAGCRRMAHLARGWHLVDFDGNVIDVPFSEANALELFSDHRMKWLQDQASIFHGDRANFPLRSATN